MVHRDTGCRVCQRCLSQTCQLLGSTPWVPCLVACSSQPVSKRQGHRRAPANRCRMHLPFCVHAKQPSKRCLGSGEVVIAHAKDCLQQIKQLRQNELHHLISGRLMCVCLSVCVCLLAMYTKQRICAAMMCSPKSLDSTHQHDLNACDCC